MNLQTVARTALRTGIKARTIWLTFLGGIFVGWMLCFAWVLVLTYAPQAAISLIARL